MYNSFLTGKAFAALMRFIAPGSCSRNAKWQIRGALLTTSGANWKLISALMSLKAWSRLIAACLGKPLARLNTPFLNNCGGPDDPPHIHLYLGAGRLWAVEVT